jgi:ATP adenylyltransferase
MKQIWSPWRMDYISSGNDEAECVFCEAFKMEEPSQSLIAYRSEKAFVILNRYPYTSGHIMVVPNVHLASIEDLDAETRAEIIELAVHATSVLRTLYQPDGFNWGINIGKAAGAGVADHTHLHIVPRWGGDTNFMTTVGNSRVLPEALEETLARIMEAW